MCAFTWKIKDDEDVKHVNDYFESLIYTGGKLFYTNLVSKYSKK